MNIALCTITFRHHLVSLPLLARWASTQGFDGIELWGAHARAAAELEDEGAVAAEDLGLAIPMVSHYLPLEGDPHLLDAEAGRLFALARRWRSPRVRIFAAGRASRAVAPADRAAITARLHGLCVRAAEEGLRLLVETHPETLADTLCSTLRLVEEVDHPALGINFDALHVWEGGDDPVEARRALLPVIGHYHLKNVRSRDDLAVFEPANVHAASGRRDGMVPLFEGAFDYRPLLAELGRDEGATVSLEWFGPRPFEVLKNDRAALRRRLAALGAAA